MSGHRCDTGGDNSPLTTLRVHRWMHALLTGPNHTELTQIMLELNACSSCTTKGLSVAAGIAVAGFTQIYGDDALMLNELTIERLQAELKASG